mmetsp:Transcript_3686/g.9287  ORF Transcript_3686/g.9287 Transcript_3686/m.9287 type:complete len:212 (+) Transcript_3686:3034-3669(+)
MLLGVRIDTGRGADRPHGRGARHDSGHPGRRARARDRSGRCKQNGHQRHNHRLYRLPVRERVPRSLAGAGGRHQAGQLPGRHVAPRRDAGGRRRGQAAHLEVGRGRLHLRLLADDQGLPGRTARLLARAAPGRRDGHALPGHALDGARARHKLPRRLLAGDSLGGDARRRAGAHPRDQRALHARAPPIRGSLHPRHRLARHVLDRGRFDDV